MSEENQVSTPEAVETETPTAEPTEVETSEVVEPVEETAKAEKDGTEEQPEWFKKDKYKTVEEQAKAYNEAEKTMHEALNKVKELERTQTEQKFTQETQQVSEGMKTLSNQYQQAIDNYQAQGNQVLEQALNALENGQISGAEYAQYVAQENEKFLSAKANIDAIYSQESSQLKGKEAELSQQRVSNSFNEFEINQADKLARPENKALYEAYKAKGYDPQDLNTVFELAETYLQSYLKSETAKKAISSDIEADKSAMTTTVGKGGVGTKPKTIQTLDDIINYL